MRIRVNGEEREFDERTTVGQLVEESGLPAHAVAVEVNEELVSRARRDEHVLVEGDRVELVTLVGGG